MSTDRPIRWGILGTGAIAAAFATDFAMLLDAEIVAVGSRTAAAARTFADRFAIPRPYGSYEALVSDAQVDAIYVATPHPGHHPHATLAIEAGKAVLVEKPFTLNAAQAAELIGLARSRNTFLMEAMWTRFLPHMVCIRELIRDGALGSLRSLTADFGECFPSDPTSRSYAPALGGGALLDLGVYPISLASMLFGRPTRISAMSHLASTGVDAQTAVILEHAAGELAVLFSSIEAHTPNTASINGTSARIEIKGDFFAPTGFRVITVDGETTAYRPPHLGRGLRHQVTEVNRCIREGAPESSTMPLAETLSIMETMDEIRRLVGVRYPAEV